MTTAHMNVSVDWMLDYISRMTPEKYKAFQVITDCLTKKDAIQTLRVLKAQGKVWIPNCNNVTENGACKGHEDPKDVFEKGIQYKK